MLGAASAPVSASTPGAPPSATTVGVGVGDDIGGVGSSEHAANIANAQAAAYGLIARLANRRAGREQRAAAVRGLEATSWKAADPPRSCAGAPCVLRVLAFA